MNDIDRLFKDGLSSFEKKPSEQAWEKITKQKKINKSSYRIQYMAAACVVLLVTAYFAFNPKKLEVNPEIASNVKLQGAVAEMKQRTKETPVNATPVIVAAVPKRISTEKIKQSGRAELSVQQKVGPVTDKLSKLDREELIPETHFSSDLDQQEALLSAHKPDKYIAEVSPMNESQSTSGLTLIVDVKLPELDLEEADQHSKLGKVFRQLKNVRAGEKVDWTEIGLKKDRDLAKK